MRGGDTSATYPPVMKVAALAGADERSVNEVFGFVSRLAYMSAAHLTDYVVDAGTVAMFGGSRADILIKYCKRVGLLTEVRVDGMKAYKIVEDPDFLHLRLKAEIEWQRQQQSDCKNEKLTVPIRLRDGDRCRYCGVMVMWLGRPSPRTGTLDHVEPGKPATVDTMVVACKGCNSGLRDALGREHEKLQDEPAEPFYSEFTADWLTNRGHPVAATQRPDSQSDPATRKTRKTTKGQRAGTQPATASSDSDPAEQDPTGHRAQPDAAPEVDLESTSEVLPVAIGTGLTGVGSGRVGSGHDPPSSSVPKPNPAGNRRRKRSRRGAR